MKSQKTFLWIILLLVVAGTAISTVALVKSGKRGKTDDAESITKAEYDLLGEDEKKNWKPSGDRYIPA